MIKQEDYDETKGWIFSDEYHTDQDSRWEKSYRHGSGPEIRQHGWYIGLYSVKREPSNVIIDDSTAATWPKPLAIHRLDIPESDE